MPNRILKEAVTCSAEVDALTPQAECCFYRLIVCADDYGTFDARPSMLRARLFPLRSPSDADLRCWFGELEANHLINLYLVNGLPYGKLITWEDHQRIRNKRPRYPLPDSNSQTIDSNSLSNVRQIKGQSKATDNPLSIDSNSPRVAARIQSNPNPIQSLTPISPKGENPPKADTLDDKGQPTGVRLTSEERAKLLSLFGAPGLQDRVMGLSLYMRSKGIKYKSHFATILSWERMESKRRSLAGKETKRGPVTDIGEWEAADRREQAIRDQAAADNARDAALAVANRGNGDGAATTIGGVSGAASVGDHAPAGAT